jgi:uroporphyrinogen III methyltransferase/synthase
MIGIAPPVDRTPLKLAAARLASFDWVVVTSVHGVEALDVEVRGVQGDSRPRTCAVGPVTAASLASAGWDVALVADVHRGEGVVDALRRAGVRSGTEVLVIRGDLAREAVVSGLKRAGANVTDVVAYRTLALPLDDAAAQALVDERVDVLIFTSGSTVENFLHACSARGITVPRGAAIACLGPVTAAAAREKGLDVRVVASTTTAEGLALAIAKFFGSG